MFLTPKPYIGSEIQRNKAATKLFAAMVRIAYGHDDAVMVGHHIGFEIGNDLETENEIPSADTLLTDHDVMRAVFGARYIAVMQSAVACPVDARDAYVLQEFLAAGHAL